MFRLKAKNNKSVAIIKKPVERKKEQKNRIKIGYNDSIIDPEDQ